MMTVTPMVRYHKYEMEKNQLRKSLVSGADVSPVNDVISSVTGASVDVKLRPATALQVSLGRSSTSCSNVSVAYCPMQMQKMSTEPHAHPTASACNSDVTHMLNTCKML